MKFNFELDKQQEEKLNIWLQTKNLNKYGGAISGRFTFCFTPTSLGVVIKVKDDMEQKDEIDLTEYEDW